MSAYVTSVRDYDSVQDAIVDSFAPGYEVHCVVATDRDDIFWAVATRNGENPAVYEYRVETHAGRYYFFSCTVDLAQAREANAEVDAVLERLG